MADIELVIKIPEKVYNALTHTEFDANLVVDEMRKSIANGTPMVRCKDCKYFINGYCYSDNFVLRFEEVKSNWFCADAERKE